MRATRRRRPLARQLGDLDPDEVLQIRMIAPRVRYVGSPEHKDTPSFAGRVPRPRPDASICARALNDQQERLTGWLQAAIERGAFGPPIESGYPRYVWYKDGDTVYEARLVNRGQGTYKGYPLADDEWPVRLGEYYE